jgi:hypothetical protein
MTSAGRAPGDLLRAAASVDDGRSVGVLPPRGPIEAAEVRRNRVGRAWPVGPPRLPAAAFATSRVAASATSGSVPAHPPELDPSAA